MTSAAWPRIVEWLEQYAPSTAANLNPPASPSAVRAAMDNFPFAAPDGLIDLWSTVDGETPTRTEAHGYLISPLYHLMPLSEAISYREMRLSVNGDSEHLDALRSGPAGTYSVFSYWLPEWIPIAGTNEGMFVDCREGPMHGCVSEHFHSDGQEGPVWGSVDEMLRETAEKLWAIDISDIDDEDPDPTEGIWYFPWG
ncbi:SMI1/KNR4 family protein [Paractinoplanes lichenicola]|uniref:SMI1/KNR4 family protein n=1 Tax=Paractinoplanes lichenicola TaxID=2802976 RepID=A0ABS1VFK5_9ACTN|nr:SMI1/KNR4 family protein [Actinoplanes lichenicola]MBL7253481.1 SMI1/KNR4 family protein [Actinoplanes lichenicola]